MINFIVGLLVATSTIAVKEPVQPRITQEMRDMTSIELKEAVRVNLGDKMVPVIACESGFRQFNDDGTILRSHTSDVGLTQINIDTWGLKAKELGYDIYTPQGNLDMAKHILKVQGPKAWVCNKLLAEK